jgi:diketogulonate reductase-like aldo/keto reductase
VLFITFSLLENLKMPSDVTVDASRSLGVMSAPIPMPWILYRPVLLVGKGYTATQSAMMWWMARGQDIIPIPGTRSIKYLEENMVTLKVKLSIAEGGNRQCREEDGAAGR